MPRSITRWAKVTTHFEGIHHFPAAAEMSQDIAFLAHPHRHIFHVTLWIEQYHDDRDVEYILAKRWLEQYIAESFTPPQLGSHSCEYIAERIANAASRVYAVDRQCRRTKCEVTEDGENGALIELEP